MSELNNDGKNLEQLNIAVAIFLFYNLSDKATEIWNNKFKHSKNWENDFISEISLFSEDEINSRYEDFLEIFAGDGSVVFDLKKNRFTDYGAKNDDIRKVKEAYINQENSRIHDYNLKNGTNFENKMVANSLIYPVDLAFIKIDVDSYGMEFSLAENILFKTNMFKLIDRIKELDQIKSIKNVAIDTKSIKNTTVQNKKFVEFYEENKISFPEYKARFEKSYFLSKNGESCLKTLYESNVILTKDGDAIIPMSKTSNVSHFNPEDIIAYQNITKSFDDKYVKLFTGNSSNSFIQLDKNDLSNNNQKIYVGEGMATCLSIKQMLNGDDASIVCAFNADNLVKVVEDLKSQNPNSKIVVCTDKDKSKVSYDRNSTKYVPDNISPGKGFLVLKNIIERIGENNVYFALPVFKDNIDNSTLVHYQSGNYKKMCYSVDISRSDYNDKNLNIEKSLDGLTNPKQLNNHEVSQIPMYIEVVSDYGNKIIKTSIESSDVIKDLKKEFVDGLAYNLLKSPNLMTEFLRDFGNDGLNKLIEKTNNSELKLKHEELSQNLKNLEQKEIAN